MLKDTIKVLVVDDSFFMRRLLREIINEDAQIEVIGEARDGVDAVEMAARLKPDVITMDYNMPKMNGPQAIYKILDGDGPLPAIIMVSAFTQEGAEETLKSLRAGAVDFIPKPSGELSLDIDKVADVIISKIKEASRAKIQKRNVPLEIVTKKESSIDEHNAAVKAVVIGASTGGPPVLEEIVRQLPVDLSFSILVVQHMPRYFTQTFAKRLNKISRIHVKEAVEGEVIRNGVVYIAPGDTHMELKRLENPQGPGVERTVHLNDEPLEEGLRPSINALMGSVAHAYASQAVGVILTGMGDDGKEGMRAIKAVLGRTIVQDPDTAVIESMPKAVINEGLADEILTPDKITKEIIKLNERHDK